MNEKLTAAKEYCSIALEAAKLCVADAVAWVDTRLADAINGAEDE